MAVGLVEFIVDVGPIKLGRKAGPELEYPALQIPLSKKHIDLEGRSYGLVASVHTPTEARIFDMAGASYRLLDILYGDQINSDPRTRDKLYFW